MDLGSFFKGIERDEILILLASLAFPWLKDYVGKGKSGGGGGKGAAVSAITAAMGGIGGNDEDLLLYLFGEIEDKSKARVLHELAQKLTPTAIRGLRLRLTSLPGNHAPGAGNEEPPKDGAKGEKRDARLSTLNGLIELCEKNGVDDTVKLLTEYGIIVQDPRAVRWLKKFCDVDESDTLTFGSVTDKLKPHADKLKEMLAKLAKDDPQPVPMGPVRYFINAILIGGDKAELVLIPRWMKNLKFKLPAIEWPFPKSKPRRQPIDYHDRIPPTL